MNPHHIPDVVRIISRLSMFVLTSSGRKHWLQLQSKTKTLLKHCSWTPKGADQERIWSCPEGEAQELETTGNGKRPWGHGHGWWEVGWWWPLRELFFFSSFYVSPSQVILVIFWYFLPDKRCSPSFVYAGSHTNFSISHYSLIFLCL